MLEVAEELGVLWTFQSAGDSVADPIRRVHMFLGILDPDPLVQGTDPAPDPSIIKQR